MHATRLKIRVSHLRCKVAYKTPNVRAQVEVLKDSLPFPLLSRESSVSVKKKSDRKNIYMRSTKYPVLSSQRQIRW